MALLALGVVLFFGPHVLPSVPALRRRIIVRVGFGRYRGLFSIVSLIGLVLIVIGKGSAPAVPLWIPPSWGFTASVVGMPLAFISFVSAYVPTNLKRVVAHPMLCGVALWAGLHLLCNGDLASAILFGSFAAFSVFDIVSANRRGAERSQEKLPRWRDLVPVVGGVVAYFVFLHYHQDLFGRAVLPYWKALWT